MKITALKTYLVDSGSAKHWLFVKVETDEGLHGWGEAYTQLDRDRQLEVQIQELARYVEGRNPLNIKHFCYMAYNDFAGKRGSLELFCASNRSPPPPTPEVDFCLKPHFRGQNR